MRGTKRSAISDSTPIFNSNDSFMQSKRVTTGSPFDANIRPPPLDEQRAESSRQHVRALNTQFASWVQTQLQDHPDELWEDGVNDYLNHAKSIMEKFSDVVNWLKANAMKGGSSDKHSSDNAQTKPAFETDKSSHKLFLDKPMFPVVTTASSGTSWKPGSLFSTTTTTTTTNAPFSFGGLPGSQVSVFGNANAVTSNLDASNEADGVRRWIGFRDRYEFNYYKIRLDEYRCALKGGENAEDGYFAEHNKTRRKRILAEHNKAYEEDDVERPSSPSLKKSPELGIVVVHEVKCKLYVKSTDPADKDAWKDKGTGQLSIKCKEGISKGTKESKPTIVIRNDVGKVLLNALIYPGIKTNVQKNSVVSIFHTSDDGDNNDNVVARTFLMRTKTEEDRDKLAAAIQEYAPAS